MNREQFNTQEEYLAYQKGWRDNNRKKVREYNLKYNKEYRKKNGYLNEENSKKRYPLKQKARSILQRAVKNRIVEKPKYCEVISCLDSPQGHHEDYTKPLEVQWLCSLHHKEKHLLK